MTTRTRDYLLRKLERRSRAAARKDDVFRAGGAIVWRQDGQFHALRRDMDAGLERCITLSRRHARRISGDLEATRTDLFRRMDEQRYRLADSVAERVDKYHRSVNNSVDKLRVHLRDRLEAIEKILEPMTIQHRAIFELTRAARPPRLGPTTGLPFPDGTILAPMPPILEPGERIEPAIPCPHCRQKGPVELHRAVPASRCIICGAYQPVEHVKAIMDALEKPDADEGPEVHAVRQPTGPGDPPGP